MLKCFYPDEYLDSTYSIDFGKLKAEGYRGVLFDIDIRWCHMEPRRMRGPSGCLKGCGSWAWTPA